MSFDNTAMSRRRAPWLLPVIALGLFTLIGSESVDKDDTPDAPPVTTTVVVRSLTDTFKRDRGDDLAIVSDLRLSGSYSADAGNALSLDRDFVNIDPLTAFTVDVTQADPDDLLTGTASLTVSEPVDFGIGRDPANGRFFTLYAATTTIVRAGDDVSGVAITVGGGAEQSLAWNEFRDAQFDANDPLDIRMASYAYGILTSLYEAALLVEQTHLDVQDNRGDLQSMGIGQSLNLTCNTPTGGTAGQRALVWRTDATGAGQGTAGDADTFEEQFGNCLFRGTGDFLDGGIALSDYLFDDAPPKRLAANIEISTLFVGSAVIDVLPLPAPDLPRLDGQLILDYQQQAAAPAR